MINELRRSSNISPSELILPTALGPITLQSLNVLDGWRWILTSVGYPGTQPILVQGGVSQQIIDVTDEKGWVVNGAIAFSSPYGEVSIIIDDWTISQSPFFIDIFNPIHKGNTILTLGQYTPVTPLGPIYAIGLDPAYPLSYARRLRVTASLPANVPVAACNMVVAEMGRVAIVDETTFLRSVKRHIATQMTGIRMERYI